MFSLGRFLTGWTCQLVARSWWVVVEPLVLTCLPIHTKQQTHQVALIMRLKMPVTCDGVGAAPSSLPRLQSFISPQMQFSIFVCQAQYQLEMFDIEGEFLALASVLRQVPCLLSLMCLCLRITQSSSC